MQSRSGTATPRCARRANASSLRLFLRRPGGCGRPRSSAPAGPWAGRRRRAGRGRPSRGVGPRAEGYQSDRPAAGKATGTMSLKHALERSGFGPCHHNGRSVCPPGAGATLAIRRRRSAGGLGRRVRGLSLAGGLAGRASLARTCRRLSAIQGDPIRAAGSGLVDQLVGHDRRPVQRARSGAPPPTPSERY
jgi:hypothetical protein